MRVVRTIVTAMRPRHWVQLTLLAVIFLAFVGWMIYLALQPNPYLKA